ncbi:MAG: hypothetical protein ABJA20_10105 [Novosphingobium sp.]
MLKRQIFAFAILLIAAPVGAKTGNRCGTYPEGVDAFSDCILREAGEKALWRGSLPRGVIQVIRFTFTEGHLAYTKVIDLTERANGKATIRLQTFRRERDGHRSLMEQRNHRLSTEELTTIDLLGSSSGTWEHRIGSWDGDEIFMHCETLDMERATRTTYSFASVSISCNQPKKLMPLVHFITGLVSLRPYADRQMF